MGSSNVSDFIDFIGIHGSVSLLSEDMGFSVCDRLADTETYKAYCFVKNKNPTWIGMTKKRISKDPANVRSYLGELRAYADVLKFPFYNVTPNSKSKRGVDFELTEKSTKNKIKIEAYTQMPKEHSMRPEDENKNNSSWLRETAITPLLNWEATLRKVQPSDVSISMGSIMSIGGSKKDAHQVDPNIPTYLYIDFQQIWGLDCEQALPLLSQAEFLTSGILWMAFYGKKDMPILENMSMEESIIPQKMPSDGFFWKFPSNGFAGALLRCRRNQENPLVFLENPTKKTPQRFIYSLMHSGLMNIEKSCWSFSGILSRVKSANAMIRSVVNKGKRMMVAYQMSKPNGNVK